MTDQQKLTQREKDAIEVSIAVAWEGRLKPKRPQERDFIWEEARKGMAKLRNGELK